MENVKEQEEVSTKRMEASGLTNRDAMSLNQALVDISNSTANMPGKVIYAITKSKGKIDSAVKLVEKTRQKLLKQYVEVNKDGSFKLTEPTEEEVAQGMRPEYVYKDPENGPQDATTEFNKLLDEECDVDLHKIPLHMFENLVINTQRVNFLDIFIEHMVYEEPQMMIQ